MSDKGYRSRALNYLSPQAATADVTEFFRAAKESKVRAALCGGLAMYFYGSDRFTKDIDFIADGPLAALKVVRKLSFGGVAYQGTAAEVDWILRADDSMALYQSALDERARMGDGWFIIRPTYLILMKILAGRSKDHQDAVFLLRQKDLVDRAALKRLAKKLYGSAAAPMIHEIETYAFEADRANKLDEGKD